MVIGHTTLPPTLQSAYPWQGTFIDVDGGRMHVLDVGPRDAPVMLALHGNPTWSFYWRKLIARYSDRYRVIAPDHIGCGLSDKPQDWPYRLADHVANVQAVIRALGLSDITFVLHDWGGAIGMGVATHDPSLAKRFVVTNTAAWRSLAIPPSIATCKIPLFGALAVRGFNGFARVATVRATYKGLDQVAKQGLLHPYDSWANRIATLRFVEDIPLHPAHPSYAELARIDDGLAALKDHPMLVCWGDDDFCFTTDFRKEWERRFPDAEVHAWPDVGHYVMEDAPDRMLGAMDAFLEAHP
jgi:haloalkane dehalogenase